MYPLLKRILDLCTALFGFLFLAPFLALLAVMVGMCLGRPVLYVQTRSGRGGQPFEMYKFRTMSDERDADGELLPDGERLGTLGWFLRSTSLDELPELVNVMELNDYLNVILNRRRLIIRAGFMVTFAPLVFSLAQFCGICIPLLVSGPLVTWWAGERIKRGGLTG